MQGKNDEVFKKIADGTAPTKRFKYQTPHLKSDGRL